MSQRVIPKAAPTVADADALRSADVVVERLYKPTLFGLYAAVVMDVIISTYSEHVYSDNIVLHIASFGVQILAYFGSLTCFFLLLSETFLVQKAMYRRVMDDFRWFFYTAGAYFLVLLSLRLYNLGMVYSYYPKLLIWQQPFYYPLYCIHKLAAVAYWWSVLRNTAYISHEPRLYTPECLTML